MSMNDDSSDIDDGSHNEDDSSSNDGNDQDNETNNNSCGALKFGLHVDDYVAVEYDKELYPVVLLASRRKVHQ